MSIFHGRLSEMLWVTGIQAVYPGKTGWTIPLTTYRT